MSGITGTLSERLRDFSVSPSSVNNNDIGKKLISVSAEEIEMISDKMHEILSNGLILKHNPSVSDWSSIRTKIETDAKSLLLKKTPFEFDLRQNFAHGEGSFLILGYPLEYSYEGILQYAMSQGEISLRNLIGAELDEKKQYRISFRLDLEAIRDCGKLVFIITQKDGDIEISKDRYMMDRKHSSNYLID